MAQPVRAADHGDAPALAHDQAADIADVFFFLDPTDNTKAVLIATFHGFIVPSEAVNFAVFDPAIRYRFNIFNDHVNVTPPTTPHSAVVRYLNRVVPNQTIDITFSPRTSTADAQTATIQFLGFNEINRHQKFTAPALNPNLGAGANSLAPAINPLESTGITFFAGEVDDPFFFDIPAFSRFVKKALAGDVAAPNELNRGRDSFAGYNTLAIALEIPVSMLKQAPDKPLVGLNFVSLRHNVELQSALGPKGVGVLKQVDRMGNPGVNVALIPFAHKNLYNLGNPKLDASGFYKDDILATLTALQTNQSNINTLASIAILRGDVLTLDTTKPNSGVPGSANGFPNGRRVTDDTIDTLLNVITNGGITAGDHVNSSDSQFPQSAQFPFLAPADQPRDPNIDPIQNVDDKTRN